jgi:hypothetical protein
MKRDQRRAFYVIAFVALALTAVQALTGDNELVFWATPFFLLVSLLATDRYLFEDRILAIVVRARRPRARIPQRWPARPLAALATLLERSPFTGRGPPATLVSA